MNKIVAALVALTFAAVAGAQTPAPAAGVKAKQDMVKSTTEAASNANTGATTAAHAEKNVAKSKKHAKMSKKAKHDAVKSTTEAASTTHTGATTADQAAKATAMSKSENAVRNAAPKMGTPAADSAMQKASKP